MSSRFTVPCNSWTQEMVAELGGVDSEIILRIERGARLPSLPTLDRPAGTLQCSAGYQLLTEGPEGVSEAATFCAWTSELWADDRAFVMSVVWNCCEYLGSRSK